MSNGVIDFAPVKNCKSLELTYGEICVWCNKCDCFNQKCLICNKVIKPGNCVIEVELYDVFSAVVCPGHEELIKKYGKFDKKYKKYIINMTKREFKNKTKGEKQ
jgi:hypothetical protein